jgi:hypothetical protein
MRLIIGSLMLVRNDGGNSGLRGKGFLDMKEKRIKCQRTKSSKNINLGQNI